MTLSGPLSHLSSQHCSSSSSSSESLSGDSPTESSCPSTISASSDEEQEPHIFSSVTKVAYDKVAPITWGSPSSFIPKRGRLFVNVVRQDGTTFSSRSSIFSRNHTPSVSRPASEIAVIDEIPNAEVDTNGPLELKDDSPLADLPTLGPRGTDPAVPGVLRVDATKTGDGIHNTLALPQVSKLASSSIPIPSPSVISNSFDDRLLFAVPKKGRLHDKCMDLLRRADLQFAKPNRLDICVVKNLPITLVFLPAADIPRFVGQSNVDISITGQDVVLESGIQSLTKEMLRLGFGRCKLQVQVPANSKIEREEDLAGRRIATSFETIAGEHFGKIDRRMGTKTRIEYLSGSVETACTLGLAEGIVDLVESGETMQVAGLKPISTIMSSEAVLILSSRPKKPHMSTLVEQLKSRLAGVVASSKYVLCQYNVRRTDLAQAKAITPGRRSATVSSLDGEEWVAVSSMVEQERVAMVMDELQAVGAEDIIMMKIENCQV